MRRPVLLVALAGLALPACGLGQRSELADAITTSTTLAVEERTVAGTISASLQFKEAPIALAPGATDLSIEVTSPFVADLADQRSFIDASALVHDGLVTHLRRADAEEGDARPWLTLDLAELDDNSGLPFTVSQPVRPPFTVLAVPPVVLVDLIAGALTGSLESLGTDDIAGVAVTGYRGNFDLDKVMDDTREDAYDEDRRDAVEQTFESIDIDGSVFPGEVWIDGDGLPRRFSATFEQRPRRRWAFELTVTLDLEQWGVPVEIDSPTDDQTIVISSVTRLVTELGRSFAATMPQAAAVPDDIAAALAEAADGEAPPAEPGSTETTESDAPDTSDTTAPEEVAP